MTEIKTSVTSAGRVVNSGMRDPDEIFVEKFGQKWIDYRKRWVQAANGETVEDFPLFVRLEAQFKCNSNCALCVHGHDELKKAIAYNNYMPFDTFRRLVDECVEHKCPSIAISFINEPLMDPDFLDRLRYVTEKEIMDIHLNSNAMLLTRELSDAILDSGATRICFSLDAVSEKIFKKMRPNLNFDAVVSNIENFITLRNQRGQALPLVRVSFLLNEINRHEVSKFRDIWTKKVDYVSIQRYVPISTRDDDRLAHAIDDAPVDGEQKCSYPWESLFVHGDGVVVPCAAHRGRFISVGNINESTLHEIWHSPAMEELRHSLKTNQRHMTKLCGTCLV